MSTMIGRRVDFEIHLMQPGDYGKDARGFWSGVTPTGLMANVAKHQVVEHEDGTITVSPSILVKQGDRSWHGYLEKGVWREC